LRPLVSVVIPTYNRGPYCLAAVRSALGQNYKPIEIVVVDDGSIDGTSSLLRSVEGPVRYIRQENAERAAARNRGVLEAKGELVAFLDSDDLWSRDHLSNSVAMLVAHPRAALSFARAAYITDKGHLLGEAPSPRLPPGLAESHEAVRAISKNFVPFPLSSVVARREVLLKCRFNEDRSLSRSEDWELWARIASRYPVVATGKLSVFIRIHRHNTSRDADLAAKAMKRALELAFEDPIAGAALASYREDLESAIERELARLYAMCGRKAEARAELESLSRRKGIHGQRQEVWRLRAMLWLPMPLSTALRATKRALWGARSFVVWRRKRLELQAMGVDFTRVANRDEMQ